MTSTIKRPEKRNEDAELQCWVVVDRKNPKRWNYMITRDYCPTRKDAKRYFEDGTPFLDPEDWKYWKIVKMTLVEGWV